MVRDAQVRAAVKVPLALVIRTEAAQRKLRRHVTEMRDLRVLAYAFIKLFVLQSNPANVDFLTEKWISNVFRVSEMVWKEETSREVLTFPLHCRPALLRRF